MINTHLYHYTSLNGLKGIINEQAIRATGIRYLNDGKEFIHALDIFNKKIKKSEKVLSRTLLKSIDALNEIPNSIEKSQAVSPFVASFSLEGDLLSQWRGYCRYGDAYDLCFDITHMSKFVGFDRETKLVVQLNKCVYREEEQERLINSFIRKHWKTISEGSLINGQPEGNQCVGDFFSLATQLKEPSFYEEKEWRFVVFLPAKLHKYVKTRQGNSGEIPYINLSLLDECGRFCLNNITVGPTPNFISAINNIRSFLNERQMTACSVLKTKNTYREM